MMTSVLYLIISFSIILFFYALYRAYKGEQNFLNTIYKNLKKFNNKKKIIFFISSFFFTLPYSFLLIYRLFYILIIILCGSFGLFLRIDIKLKIKDWEYLNYSYDSSIKLRYLIWKIFRDIKINQHNKSYFLIYFFIKKQKKNYKEIMESIGFYNFTGFSRNYVENIIYFVNILNVSKIDKKISIKIKIIFRRTLFAILGTLNQDYFVESMYKDTMKIKIESFWIEVNGNTGSKTKINDLLMKNQLKILGQEIDKNKSYGNKHLIIEALGELYALTSSKNVKCDNSPLKEKVKSIECGKQENGKKQYALPFEKKEDYNDRFEIDPQLDRKMIEGFGLKDKNKFTGIIIKNGLIPASQDKNEIISKGKTMDKKEGKFEQKIKLEKDELEFLENNDYKTIGHFVRNNIGDNERFELEKTQKTLIRNSEKKDGYYDDN